MVAHDIAPAYGGKANLLRLALASVAVALEYGALLQIAAQGCGNDFAHFQGRAAGRVHLVAVVRLNDLDVIARGKRLGGHFQKLEGHVHAHAHVG